MTPFAHPPSAHTRRHAPAGYVDYQNYKPWLRDEFQFRCVYCLERERWYPSHAAAFSVDHVVPQVDDPSRICDYANLVYACPRCNSLKQDIGLADPSRVCFAECLSLADDATYRAQNEEGADLIDVLHLNDSVLVTAREKYLRVIALRRGYPDDSRIRDLFLDTFDYPDDLPDLASKRPPGGNRPVSGPAQSYFELRYPGRLGEIY